MPRAKKIAQPENKSANRKSKASGLPKAADRQLEVVHAGLGHHVMGARLNQDELGDRENIRRLLDLGAVRWYLPPPPDPVMDEDEDLEDDEDEDESDEDDLEDEDDEDDEEDEKEEEPTVPTSPATVPSPKPLITKVNPSSAQTSGASTSAPRVQDLSKK